jgi:hypothetical protein
MEGMFGKALGGWQTGFFNPSTEVNRLDFGRGPAGGVTEPQARFSF